MKRLRNQIAATFVVAAAVELLRPAAAQSQCGLPPCNLTHVQTVLHASLLGDGMQGGAYGIVVSPDGKSVYVVPNLGDRIVLFSRNATTGELTFVEAIEDNVGGVDGLDGPFDVAVSPDNKNVYVASDVDDAVAVFGRNTTTGQLTFLEWHKDGVAGVDGLEEAYSTPVSPDGKNVYVVGEDDDAVAVFARDPSTGLLTFLEVHRDGVGGVNGLDAAYTAAVSADGKHVLVASRGDNAVAVFSRNLTDGRLTFQECAIDNVNGVEGLGGATYVYLSPPANDVYVAGIADHAVAVFDRDQGTGALAFREVKVDGVGDVPALTLATVRSAAVSADGACVFSAAFFVNTLGVFNRNSSTGALTYLERHGQAALNLNGPVEVAVSPTYQHVYVTGQLGPGQVTVFRRPP